MPWSQVRIHSLCHSSYTPFEPVVRKKGMLKKDFVALGDSQMNSPSGIPSRRHHFDRCKRLYHGFHPLLHHGLGSFSLTAGHRCIAARISTSHSSSLPMEECSLAAGESVTAEGTIVPQENSSSFWA